METLTYLTKAGSAWFMGFFPLFEIYVAVPAAIALQLDYTSAVVWSVLGNFSVVPLLILFSTQPRRIGAVDRWMSSRNMERWAPSFNRYGSLFVLLMTPILGVWFMTPLAQAMGMKPTRLMISALLSISVYAVVIASSIALGLGWFTA